MPPPGFDQDPGLGQGVEDFPVQELVTHRAVPPPPPPPPPNNPPVANTDSVTVKVCLGTSKNVTANDTDPDGDLPLSVTAVGTSTLADVYIIDQSTIGVAAYGAPGSGVVTYTITDSRGATASGYLNITVQNGTGCQ